MSSTFLNESRRVKVAFENLSEAYWMLSQSFLQDDGNFLFRSRKSIEVIEKRWMPKDMIALALFLPYSV